MKIYINNDIVKEERMIQKGIRNKAKEEQVMVKNVKIEIQNLWNGVEMWIDLRKQERKIISTKI